MNASHTTESSNGRDVFRRNDLLAIQAIAARAPEPSGYCVELVALRFSGKGISLSLGEITEMAKEFIVAAGYQPPPI